jgi:hypothetical protein
MAHDVELSFFPRDQIAVVPNVCSSLNGHEWMAPRELFSRLYRSRSMMICAAKWKASPKFASGAERPTFFTAIRFVHSFADIQLGTFILLNH